MSSDYFRIHSSRESLENILDPSRKDGWVASDEAPETQPVGISCCVSIEDLKSYINHYSMSVRTGDTLVRVIGTLSYDEDRDRYAVRVCASSYEVMGDAREWFSSEEG